ncbi:hypothetical protein HD806DRAFT_296462 [Xylariaceae sp. AK1471]|nr:hypothetical protein HD806DRAFT_296462 [Xylariaceae sp. AK1471]
MPPELDPAYYPSGLIRLYSSSHQLHQSLLNYPLTILHFGIVSFRLAAQFWVSPESHSQPLKTLTIVDWILGFLCSLIWRLLFRRLDVFLWFRRPSRLYLRAIYFTTFATTVPNFSFHIAIIYLSSKIERDFTRSYSHGAAIAAFLILAPRQIYFLWMVHKYLLDDVTEHYEPTIQHHLRRRWRRYSDESLASSFHSPLLVDLTSDSNLFEVYSNQPPDSLMSRSQRPLGKPAADMNSSSSIDEATSIPATSGESSSALPDSHMDNNGCNTDCPTLAYFDYIPQSDIGWASWVSYPIFSASFGILSSVVLWKVLILIYENNKELRIRSPNTIYGLYMPIVGYVLCIFSAKHRLRTSLFIRRTSSLPGGWTRIRRLLRPPIYFHAGTGTATPHDPRLTQGYQLQSRQRGMRIAATEHVKIHNSTLAGIDRCESYLGHRGRDITIRRRFFPILVRLSFLALVYHFFFKGVRSATSGTQSTLGYPQNPIKDIAEMNQRSKIHAYALKMRFYITPLRFLLLHYLQLSFGLLIFFWITSLGGWFFNGEYGVKWSY